MRSENRKIHFRVIDRNLRAIRQMFVPCGTNAHWTKDTTSNPRLVTCARCKIYILKGKATE